MNQTWTTFKRKVDAAIERKGLDGSQVRIDFIWASGEDNVQNQEYQYESGGK